MSHQSISLSLLYQILPTIECCPDCKFKQLRLAPALYPLQSLHMFKMYIQRSKSALQSFSFFSERAEIPRYGFTEILAINPLLRSQAIERKNKDRPRSLVQILTFLLKKQGQESIQDIVAGLVAKPPS